MSLNFVAALFFGLLPSLLFKVRVVYPSFFRIALNTAKAVQKHKCRTLVAAPTTILEILDSPKISQLYDLSSLRYILSGSQIVAAELIERAFSRFSLDFFSIAYGSTEVLLSNVFIVQDLKQRNLGKLNFSIGQPLPLVEQKVVDVVTKQVVPKNRPGILYTKSFSIFNAYWNDRVKTNETIGSDGWLVFLYF